MSASMCKARRDKSDLSPYIAATKYHMNIIFIIKIFDFAYLPFLFSDPVFPHEALHFYAKKIQRVNLWSG